MTERLVVYGAAGTGSVAVEAALTILGLPFDVEETSSSADAAFARVNPMGQVPAVALPSGELMTESAAILIRLADSHPTAGLSPALDSPARPAFLRWMAFVSAAIYSLYWIRDDPSRLTSDTATQAVVMERTAARIAACWAVMEAGLSPGTYLLGNEMTVLDLYVAVTSRWRPRRTSFYRVAPRMGDVVRRVDADPRLADLWTQRLPFAPGWEG